MPKNSKVGKMYDAMVRSGTPKNVAAATAQKRTGQSLATGRKAKTHHGKPARGKHSTRHVHRGHQQNH